MYVEVTNSPKRPCTRPACRSWPSSRIVPAFVLAFVRTEEVTFFNFNQRELVCPAQRPSTVLQRSLVPARRLALWPPPSPGPGRDPARTPRRRITAPRGGGRRSGSRLRVRTRPRAAPKASVLFTMEEAADGLIRGERPPLPRIGHHAVTRSTTTRIIFYRRQTVANP